MDSRAIAGLISAWVLLSLALTGTMATTFTVGGGMGWMVPMANSGLNYTVWAQNVTAHVGDSLYFKYNPNGHNVMKVNSTVYATCNTTHYLEIWDTGDTTVPLEETGTEYFICGAPRHCLMGQAFAIEVYSNKTDSGSPGSTPSVLSPPGDRNAAPPMTVVHFWTVVLVSTVVLFSSSLLC